MFSLEQMKRRADRQAAVALNQHVKCLSNSRRIDDHRASHDRLDAAYDNVARAEQALEDRDRRAREASGIYY